MTIGSISSAITNDFLAKIGTNSTSTSTIQSAEVSTGAVKTLLSGFSSSVSIFTNAVKGLNGVLNLLNVTSSDLTKLSSVTDDMIKVATEASQSGIGSLQRSDYNKKFQQLVTKFQTVISAHTGQTYNTLNEGDLEKIFTLIGFNKTQSASFAAIINGFQTNTNTSGNASLASDSSQARRPVQIPQSAFQTLVTNYGSQGSGSFAVSSSYSQGTASGYQDVQLKDVNGDGKADLVSLGGSKVYVQLGNGDGTFSAAASFQAPALSTAGNFQLVDVNGDGRLDLLDAANGGTGVSTYVSQANGDGSFQAPVSYIGTASPAGATSIATGNLDAGATVDVVYASATTVGVQLGNSDGTLNAATIFVGSAGSSIQAVQVGTVNNDATNDIVTATGSSVNVLVGNGDGTFLTSVSYATTGSTVEKFSLVDLNGDGFNDIAVTDSTNGKVDVLLNNGDGTFKAAVSYGAGTSGGGASSVQATDINGDGHKDLVVTNPGDGTVSVLFGNANGTFQAAISSPVTAANGTVVGIGDINGDGRTDLAVGLGSSDRIEVLKGMQTMTTSTETLPTTKDFSSLFETDRNISTRPNAYTMVADLKALKNQLDANNTALNNAITYLANNVYMLRDVAIAIQSTATTYAKKPPANLDALTQAVRDQLKSIPAAQVQDLQNLDALTTASMTTDFATIFAS